ncbi:MAG: hypothetical protein NTX53_01040 [candidate division WOR-3 bacterium]|nr:hypothetical protein [candidate division WOR-3 bacterium]
MSRVSLSVVEAKAVVALAALAGCTPTLTVKAQAGEKLEAAERELSVGE